MPCTNRYTCTHAWYTPGAYKRRKSATSWWGLGKSGTETGTGIFLVKAGRGRGPGLSQGAGCGAVTVTGNHRVMF